MKRLFLIIMAASAIMCSSSVYAQSVYRMYSNGGGGDEYIDNLRNASGSTDRNWGVRFSAAKLTRGFVNTTGQWGFLKPNSTYFTSPGTLSNIIGYISNLTVGVEGWLCAEGLSVRPMNQQATNTLDLLTTPTRSTITSNGDPEGLHIRSAIGHKIYMYDMIYWDHNYWTSMGPGRNDDPTINNSNQKMLRIGSNGGIGFWGTAGVTANDTPSLYVSGESMQTRVPVTIKPNDSVTMFLGTSTNDNDGWMGTYSNHGLHLGTNNGSAMFIGTDRNLYIGLNDTEAAAIRAELKSKYTMFIAKGALSEDYAIAPKSSWSDFVFQSGYQLPGLSEVENFIKTNRHLPNVPSALEVAEDGYSQHDMNKVLLQKIEELTLYTIQQQKEIEELKAKLEESK